MAEWKTRRTQNPLSVRACGFESRSGHCWTVHRCWSGAAADRPLLASVRRAGTRPTPGHAVGAVVALLHVALAVGEARDAVEVTAGARVWRVDVRAAAAEV